MESIGEKLRVEREQKGLSVEQVARDTNIAKRYLHALETEDFSVFPGDPYLIGFLRNYAEYLGLDPEEMVSLYKNFTIQSQPVPMDELLDNKRSKRGWIYLIGAIIIAGLVVGGYFLSPVVFGQRDRAESEVVSEEPAAGGTIYRLDSRRIEERFIVDDVVTVELGESEYEITITTIDDRVTLGIPGGTNVLRIGDERAVDLDGDASMDVRIALTDIDADARPASAVVRVERYRAEPGLAPEPTADTTAEAEPTAPGAGAADIGTSALGSRRVEPVNLVTNAAIEPFRISVVFRGHCLLRYLIDGDQREQRYYRKGETIELDVSRSVRLWISNAGNMITRVNGTELNFGRPGEVSTRLIGWEEDPRSDRYVLRMSAMY